MTQLIFLRQTQFNFNSRKLARQRDIKVGKVFNYLFLLRLEVVTNRSEYMLFCILALFHPFLNTCYFIKKNIIYVYLTKIVVKYHFYHLRDFQ